MVEKYLTQNAIWSVETFGVDAFRVDTYKYCNVDVMNRLNKSLLDEYPKYLHSENAGWMG
jgi:1,4-alpha-glucan branching enzyme